ncbi:hypothetical protein Tcan_08717 [Toxocara canis]|uniref:Uncharacterized protein n=1 Tax=Toxocara canis TaxID=6265 RepID=A0A0B2VER9_TOXCA|nr:hypothetical protein Tcan_08717 [Toxocara canis]
MVRYPIVMYVAAMIGISSTQHIDSSKQSLQSSQAYPNHSILFPPTIANSEKQQILPSKQPPESAVAEKSLAQLQEKKEREIEETVSAIMSSNRHSAEQFRPPSSEAPQQPTDESFIPDWDSSSNKWSLPQFGPQNGIPPLLFPSLTNVFDSDFASFQRKHIDEQYGIPTVEEVKKASHIVQSNMQHPLMPQLMAETFSFLDGSSPRSLPVHTADRKSSVPPQ